MTYFDCQEKGFIGGGGAGIIGGDWWCGNGLDAELWGCGNGCRVANCEIFCKADNADVALELILSVAENVCHADFSTRDARKGCNVEAAAKLKGDWCCACVRGGGNLLNGDKSKGPDPGSPKDESVAVCFDCCCSLSANWACNCIHFDARSKPLTSAVNPGTMSSSSKFLPERSISSPYPCWPSSIVDPSEENNQPVSYLFLAILCAFLKHPKYLPSVGSSSSLVLFGQCCFLRPITSVLLVSIKLQISYARIARLLAVRARELLRSFRKPLLVLASFPPRFGALDCAVISLWLRFKMAVLVSLRMILLLA